MIRRPEHAKSKVRKREPSEARFRKFAKELHVYEQKISFDDTMDTFLELYSAWMKTREPWLKLRILMLAFELKRLKPAFTCTLEFPE